MAIIYADENVSSLLSDLLRSYGHVVYATYDEGRSTATDGSELLYAADRGWIVLTHNRADFLMLHDAWHLWSHSWNVRPEHAGIIVLEPVQSPLQAEIATLVHEICEQNALTNMIFVWKRATGWERNPRR
jgi:hypothetical protein